jgi:ankyrin repeat protein
MTHMACADGKLDVSRLLINHGSDINSRDTDQFIPLHMASRFGHADIARLLLERGSDVNMCESQCWTPLHYASRMGFVGLAQVLVDHGADVNINIWTENEETPLYLTSSNGKVDVARFLIQCTLFSLNYTSFLSIIHSSLNPCVK